MFHALILASLRKEVLEGLQKSAIVHFSLNVKASLSATRRTGTRKWSVESYLTSIPTRVFTYLLAYPSS